MERRPFECLAPYLPDIDWTHPGAQAQFIDDAVFWVEEYGVDGFRVDALSMLREGCIQPESGTSSSI